MSHGSPGQLELFEVSRQSGPPQREAVGRLLVSVRYDQLMLVAIGALVGTSIVFAVGVERGKQLARAERPVLGPSVAMAVEAPVVEAVVAQAQPEAEAPAQKKSLLPRAAAPAPKAEKAAPVKAEKVASPSAETQTIKAPSAPLASEPKAEGASAGKYAIQVVTYSKPQLARKELQRLQDKGEQAYLVTRQGRTILYVGPFPSKIVATEKLSVLKTQYNDCFLKPL